MTSVDLPDWVPGPTPGPTLLLGSVRVAVPNGGTTGQVVLSSAGLSQIVVLGSSTVGGPATISVKWYQNQSLVGPVIQQVTVQKNSTSQTVAVFPVLAPWFQVYWTNSSGGAQTVTLEVYGYNTPWEVKPSDVAGRDPVIAVANFTTVVGSEFYPSNNLPGSAQWWVQCDGTAAVKLPLMFWNGATWIHIYSVLATTAGQPYLDAINLPLSDWRIEADTAATGLNMAVIPE